MSKAKIVFIYKNGALLKINHFSSTRQTSKYLRGEGCKVANNSLANLDEDSAIFFHEDLTYEVQEEVLKNGTKG